MHNAKWKVCYRGNTDTQDLVLTDMLSVFYCLKLKQIKDTKAVRESINFCQKRYNQAYERP